MHVGYVQMPVEFGQVEQNINTAISLLDSQKADLFVLPELFNTGYVFTSHEEVADFAERVPEGETTQQLIKIAQSQNGYIVAGLAEKCDNKIYNSAVLVGPQGFIDVYRKIHLFYEEKKWFAPGNKPFFVVDIGIAKIGMMICFDWIFPESMRSLALLGADIVCHPSNLVLPYCQHAMITRCLENNVFAITANRIGCDERGDKRMDFTGKSQVVAPKGARLLQAPLDEPHTGIVKINVGLARDKILNSFNNLVKDRRENMYGVMKRT